jgi:hypothetical protein
MRVVIGCESAVEGRGCELGVVVRVSGERGERVRRRGEEIERERERERRKRMIKSADILPFRVSSRSRFDVPPPLTIRSSTFDDPIPSPSPFLRPEHRSSLHTRLSRSLPHSPQAHEETNPDAERDSQVHPTRLLRVDPILRRIDQPSITPHAGLADPSPPLRIRIQSQTRSRLVRRKESPGRSGEGQEGTSLQDRVDESGKGRTGEVGQDVHLWIVEVAGSRSKV